MSPHSPVNRPLHGTFQTTQPRQSDQNYTCLIQLGELACRVDTDTLQAKSAGCRQKEDDSTSWPVLPGRLSGDMKAEKAEVSLLRRGDRRPLYTSPPRGDCSPPDEADTSAAAASATSTGTSGREGEHGSSPAAAPEGATADSAAARAGPPLPSAGLAAFVGVLRSASARLFVGVLCELPPCTSTRNISSSRMQSARKEFAGEFQGVPSHDLQEQALWMVSGWATHLGARGDRRRLIHDCGGLRRRGPRLDGGRGTSRCEQRVQRGPALPGLLL